jgi:hypothetical protein
MPWLGVARHPGDYVLSRPVQHLEDIRMRRVRVVVKELDPPITLAADFSRSVQDHPLEHLSAFYSLDCTDQAMAALSIPQPALAPLLFGCEQALHRPEFRKLTRSNGFYSVERHVITPLYVVEAYPRPQGSSEDSLLCLALILTFGWLVTFQSASIFPRKPAAAQLRSTDPAAKIGLSMGSPPSSHGKQVSPACE